MQKAIKSRGDEVAWFLSGKEINKNYLHQDETCLHTVKQVKNYSPFPVFVILFSLEQPIHQQLRLYQYREEF